MPEEKRAATGWERLVTQGKAEGEGEKAAQMLLR
jgi:hypothetical protein